MYKGQTAVESHVKYYSTFNETMYVNTSGLFFTHCLLTQYSGAQVVHILLNLQESGQTLLSQAGWEGAGQHTGIGSHAHPTVDMVGTDGSSLA